MEELIKEAKWLYFQIENTQEKLVKSRLRNEKDNGHTALMELETEMCATLQLLKCIIERKDNIVDLSEVWHNTDEEAKEGWIIGQNKYDEYDIFVGELETILPKEWFYTNNIKRWAYVKDLLPKGGEA